METLYKEIAREYLIPHKETRTLLERTLSATLSESFGKRVVVLFSGNDLSIYRERGKDGSTDLEQLPANRLSRKLLRLCRYRVGIELQKHTSLVEFDYLKSLQGSLVRGTIDRVRDNGSLNVLIRMDELFSRRVISGSCPLSLQPPRERGTYRIGDTWYFYVTRIRLICLAGRERFFGVDVILSRTSRLLPELLLKMKSGIRDISCPRRIAGKISFVVSGQRLPREAVRDVSKELGERVKVRWEY